MPQADSQIQAQPESPTALSVEQAGSQDGSSFGLKRDTLIGILLKKSVKSQNADFLRALCQHRKLGLKVQPMGLGPGFPSKRGERWLTPSGCPQLEH